MPTVRDHELTRAQKRLAALLAVAELVGVASMWIGVYLALAWRPGAYLLVWGLVTTIAVHLAQGFSRYSLVMSRPWPEVKPLEDDDDDW